MNNLKRQLNNLKDIKPNEKWASVVKTEILGEQQENSIFQVLQPKMAFGSLVMAGIIFTFAVINLSTAFPEIQMVNNEISPQIMNLVENMQNEEDINNIEEVGMMAINNEDEKQEEVSQMVAHIDFEKLTDGQKVSLAKENVETLLAEIEELEERITRVMGSYNSN